jgi:DNA-binding phage protein
MRLDHYLLKNDIEVSAFAKDIGVHRTSVYRFIKGLAFPRPETIERIIKVTEGRVTANDFLGIQPSRRKLATAG